MKQVFRIFFSAEETRPWGVLVCLILAGFAEAVSITALVPTIQAVSGNAGEAGSPSPAMVFIHAAMARLGEVRSARAPRIMQMALRFYF